MASRRREETFCATNFGFFRSVAYRGFDFRVSQQNLLIRDWLKLMFGDDRKAVSSVFHRTENRRTMRCSEVVQRIERLKPNASPVDIARMSAILLNTTIPDAIHNDESFLDSWDESLLRLQAATDQHAAIAEEMNELSGIDPLDFKAEQIWTLIRSIKVQNQLLKLYVGESVVEQ